MNIDDLLAQLPIDQIAGQLGIDPSQAVGASRDAVTALVGGLGANAQDEAGASSLQAALADHADRPDVLDAGAVDTADGEKIIRHIFGDQSDDVIRQLGGKDGIGGDLIGKLLPMLAPMVMGMLGNKLGKASDGDSGGGGGGLGDLLGGVLGGGGGGLGDLLGGLLGGGTKG